MSAILLSLALASSSPQCELGGKMMESIRKGYDKGIQKSEYIVSFPGPENRTIRNMIHFVYRGATDHMTPKEVREVFTDICNSSVDKQ